MLYQKTLLSILQIIFVLLLQGCSYLPQIAPLASIIPSYLDFSGPNMTTIEIQTTKATNYGTPFYILVKSSDFPHFLADDYQKIAALVANPGSDPTCLATVCVVPGINQTIKAETPDNKLIAIYCLFTNPAEVWKHFFELGEECPDITLVLGENEILSIDK